MDISAWDMACCRIEIVKAEDGKGGSPEGGSK